ncbi:hypothetical protein HA402_011342 [Bradysia odoriphaga]|nr:hypothetical protein HA402_011342 [Bradysia odoriphaga]
MAARFGKHCPTVRRKIYAQREWIKCIDDSRGYELPIKNDLANPPPSRLSSRSSIWTDSDIRDSVIDAVVVPGAGDGRDWLWGKTKGALKYAWEHHKDEFDWIMKADDDTYVVVDNLKKFLSNYSKTDPIFFGCQFSSKEIPFWTSGGAGYVLSKEALRRFVLDGLPNSKNCREDHSGSEDAELANCLRRVGVTLEDSRDSSGRHRFLAFTPIDHVFPRVLNDDDKKYWYRKDLTYPQVQGMDCCANDAISFHYISNREMYVLEYFLYHIRPAGIDREQKYVQELPLSYAELTSTTTKPK